MNIKSLLTMSMIIMGYFENNQLLYIFDWIWLFYFGKIFSLFFIFKEEPNSQAERQLLLEKEKDQGLSTFIPLYKYGIYAIFEVINAFCVCVELFFMSFGLFTMSQAIVYFGYLVYSGNRSKLQYGYSSALLFAGIFSLAENNDGNDKCYIGIIAAFFQIVFNILIMDYKGKIHAEYIISNTRLIGLTGLCEFVLWTLAIVFAQFVPCNTNTSCKCSSQGTLNQTNVFFKDTFGNINENIYLLILFFIMIIAGWPLTYLDNKLLAERSNEKKQIIQQLIILPIQLWIFVGIIEQKCTQTQQQKSLAFEILSMLFFIIQWFLGFYIIINGEQIEQYQAILEEEESELS